MKYPDYWGVGKYGGIPDGERSDYESSDIKKLSTSDLEQIEANYDIAPTFNDMITELEQAIKIIEKIKSNPSEENLKRIEVWGYGWAGYDDLWAALNRGNYTEAIQVLKRDISNLRKRKNITRILWYIKDGVKQELKRRRGY